VLRSAAKEDVANAIPIIRQVSAKPSTADPGRLSDSAM
jgi:hypothetical protein